MHQPFFPPDGERAAITDLYELTMAAAYFETGHNPRATFELWVRELPPQRSYLTACGLADALDYLANMRFTPQTIDYLRGLEVFRNIGGAFFDYLADFRFGGEVWAVPEGRVVFAGEPLLRVSAPLIESQIVETFLMAVMNFQTSIATKASRIVAAADDDGQHRPVTDFGLRRAHGPAAGISAARAAYVGGCAGTSNVYAGRLYGIPVFGTAAHSWTMAFDSEMEAFREYHRIFPDHTTLLIDTYDVRRGAENAAKIGAKLRGVRLDSGDLAGQSRMVRQILDEAGLHEAKIVASGDLNEYRITELLSGRARIDSFGVGTALTTSRDEPSLQMVYKLVEEDAPDGRPIYKMKLSPEKATYPCAKQVWRVLDERGDFRYDFVAAADEKAPVGAEAMLAKVMEDGRLVSEMPGIEVARETARGDLARLGSIYKKLRHPARYEVVFSTTLKQRYKDTSHNLTAAADN